MAAQANNKSPKEYVDGLFDFKNGINSGVAPLLIDRQTLAFGTNGTVRGTFLKPRPPFQKIAVSWSDPAAQQAFETGLFQAGCYYKPDSGGESLMAAVAGRLYKFLIGATTAQATDETIPGDPNPATNVQAWMWQSEKWVIWNDGVSKPVFFDQTASPTSRRSNYLSHVPFTDTVATAFTVPAVGSSVSVTLTSGANVAVGDILTFQGAGQFRVTVITGGGAFDMTNTDVPPGGPKIPVATQVSWYHLGTELPPGRMGVYGMGRNWESLVDGKQFLASDLVGGSSGTVANNFRDAVLQITENTYLAGGGNFTVPGSVGDIRAMIFTATLDKSLGQGPLAVITPNTVFSCDAPVDRTTWQSVTNPIVTESLIGNGGLGQNSTVGWNGDTIFRSIDGIRSLLLARRDFDTWGNVPISREVSRIVDNDDDTLLAYGSAIVFDNRLLMTAVPKASSQGVYHQCLIPLNADPLSSLAGKTSSVYDPVWTGLNVLQLIKGQFAGVERAFAFCLNTTLNKIELYEIYKTPPEYTSPGFLDSVKFDNGNIPIILTAETGVLMRTLANKGQFDFCRLIDGELSVDEVVGQATITVYYRPDSYPCWVLWRTWTICAKKPDPTDSTTVNFQPGFYPRMGLSEPDPKLCDPFTNRPFREAYFFELKFVIQGYCRIIGCRIKAVEMPQPEWAKPVCDNPC
jgi:hypothetical protein